jgi:hypothetical protein
MTTYSHGVNLIDFLHLARKARVVELADLQPLGVAKATASAFQLAAWIKGMLARASALWQNAVAPLL